MSPAGFSIELRVTGIASSHDACENFCSSLAGGWAKAMCQLSNWRPMAGWSSLNVANHSSNT